MKVTITHIHEESEEATAVLKAFLHLHPGAKVRKSDAHPPYKHIYLATKKPGKCTDTEENH